MKTKSEGSFGSRGIEGVITDPVNIGVGDLVQVNAAAFIGSQCRNPDTIPCEVLGLESGRVYVQTQLPYRTFTIWVDRRWVETAGNPCEPQPA